MSTKNGTLNVLKTKMAHFICLSFLLRPRTLISFL